MSVLKKGVSDMERLLALFIIDGAVKALTAGAAKKAMEIAVENFILRYIYSVCGHDGECRRLWRFVQSGWKKVREQCGEVIVGAQKQASANEYAAVSK